MGLLALSLALFAGFYMRLRRAAEPLIPLEVLLDPLVLAAICAATLSVSLFLGLAIYAPILFESVRGLSASQSGLALLPLMVGTVGGTLISGRAMAELDHYKRLPLAAMPCALAAALVLMAGAGSLPIWVVSLVLAIVSVALGTLLPISTVSIQNAVAHHRLGTATATANLCRQLGGAIMVAVFGTILLGQVSGHDAGGLVATASVADREALLVGFRMIFGLIALGSVAAFVVMVVMEERPLTGPARRGAPAGGRIALDSGAGPASRIDRKGGGECTAEPPVHGQLERVAGAA